ncbi:hypothetical protein SGLAM104S_09970 [Streptomyces glaucescens]
MAAVDLNSQLGHLARRLQQAHHLLWNTMVSEEITSPQFAVLNTLVTEPGLDQRTVGERVGLDRSTIAEVIGLLVSRGLLGKVRDPPDGRRYLLTAPRRRANASSACWRLRAARMNQVCLAPLSGGRRGPALPRPSIQRVPERLERARARGVERRPEASTARRNWSPPSATRPPGAAPAPVIDAVGTEAHGSAAAKLTQQAAALLPRAIGAPLAERFSVDRLAALHTAIDLVRRGGTLSLVGVYGGMADPLPMLTLFDKQLQIRMGQANVRRWTDEIIPYLTDEDPLGVDDFATHRVPLDDAPHAYEMFQRKREGAVKVLMQP